MHKRHITPTKFRTHHFQKGYVLVLSIIISFSLSVIGISLLSVASAKYSRTKGEVYASSATYSAEAGISTSISQLNSNGSFPGYASETTLKDAGQAGRTTYTTTVTDNAAIPGSKFITAIGKIYVPSTATAPTNTKKIRVLISKNSEPSKYAVLADYGGLTIGSGSTLLTKTIYSQGGIAVQPSSTIGTSSVPAQKIDVANAGCPPGGSASYPQPCPSASEPISVATGSAIYGNVCANNQTTTTNISQPGLVPSCAPKQSTLSTINRSQILSGATNSAAGGSCTSGSFSMTQPSIVTTDLSITGTCQATISSSFVYIQGNVTLSGANARLIVSSTASTPPIIMATGTITISNSARIIPNGGVSIRAISFHSSEPSCSSDYTCPGLSTGNARYTSAATTDAVRCISGCIATGAELTAYYGRVLLGNNATAGSVNGRSVVIDNSSGTVNITKDVSATNSGSQVNRWAIIDYIREYAS